MTTRFGWPSTSGGAHPSPAAFLRAVARAEVSVLTYAPAMAEVASTSGLDERSHALARLAATIATDPPTAVYVWQVQAALKAGVGVEEVVGLLAAIAPMVGTSRTVAAAGRLAFALGLDTGAVGGETELGGDVG
ncbi:MAG TPA: carboxymuconolactone decarboxylase family protein [Candidatus Limnocylindria bacterium]|nr:carboxymuconolactone decarboxylase family protein [Candidatus Limnocylindria bacterium]